MVWESFLDTLQTALWSIFRFRTGDYNVSIVFRQVFGSFGN
jgi:hypothetical protein